MRANTYNPHTMTAEQFTALRHRRDASEFIRHRDSFSPVKAVITGDQTSPYSAAEFIEATGSSSALNAAALKWGVAGVADAWEQRTQTAAGTVSR